MKGNESITVTNDKVVVRTGTITVTVYLNTKARDVVALNRDGGGDTETIKREA